MEWNGGCLCGEIRYRANVDPEWVAYCHCTMCRKQSGAPLTVSVLFPREAVEWTKGEPVYYRSSPKGNRGFCPNCGSTLTWETPSLFTVFVGSLDRPEDIKLDSHCHTDSQLPWIKLNDELRRHAGHDDVQWPVEGYDPVTGRFKNTE